MENPDHPTTDSLPPNTPRTLFGEIAFVVGQIPSWLFAIIALVTIFVLYQIVGGAMTFLLFGMNVSASNVDAVRWATMAGQILFLLLPTMFLARLRFPGVRNVFRFGGFRPAEIALVVLAVFALQQLLQVYLMVQESIPIHLPSAVQKFIDQVKEMMEQMYRMLTTAHSLPEFLFVVLVIAVTPAVCEELLFRGLIQRTLEDSGGAMSPDGKRRGVFAAVVTGIVFGLYHLNPFTLVPLVVLGIFFGLVVYRTQNIVTSMAAHFFNNFLACLAVYLNLDESFVAISPTTTPGWETLALNFVLAAVVFLAATYYLVRITNRTDVPSSSDA